MNSLKLKIYDSDNIIKKYMYVDSTRYDWSGSIEIIQLNLHVTFENDEYDGKWYLDRVEDYIVYNVCDCSLDNQYYPDVWIKDNIKENERVDHIVEVYNNDRFICK